MREKIFRAALAVLAAGAAALLAPAPASAHVVPSTTIELDVHDDHVTAQLTLPATDLTTASGIAVPEGALEGATATAIETYIEDHFAVTTAGEAWQVEVHDAATARTEQWGTGEFPAVTATATLTPPSGVSPRAFSLAYDAIIHQVVTADIFVILRSDVLDDGSSSAATAEVSAAGSTTSNSETGQPAGATSARNLGTITLDTRTGTVAPLDVDLDADEGGAHGFAGMFRHGMSHIAEGTDHQLFLLTLLLPAPLLAAGRHWGAVSPTARAAWRITGITVAFTIGHSVTLALGTLGLPVPRQPVEAWIAVSILTAAVHAVRPLFPGREALVAGGFGLVHGMAFSMTLSALELSGTELALNLLGFNLGIEVMQLLVVLVVLPPLVVLARTRAYTALRVLAATLTAVAATGWLLDRVGVPNPVGLAADTLGAASPWIAVALWTWAVTALVAARVRRPGEVARGDQAALPST
ncbi:HupE/UreJ family protein [Myceligenerans pegani]|uniref:HupE/UreJ family protein n=1 Tax=Myceligenerans pegani TaxID=2776917 RepID=A0ABR9N5V7_9MICO|nr:HupE/UreJ family protein [Myceligenerans sp. TRM 65318]MBE1879045.1 HupE/UreJ family protein [Myceligenerans sp. TRM 65318]MBE3021316.1 HupE/UreJ family protein [Myceligenerans sp. TRM 65318]